MDLRVLAFGLVWLWLAGILLLARSHAFRTARRRGAAGVLDWACVVVWPITFPPAIAWLILQELRLQFRDLPEGRRAVLLWRTATLLALLAPIILARIFL